MKKSVNYNISVEFTFLDKHLSKTIDYLIEFEKYEMIIISLTTNTSFDEMMMLAYWTFHNYNANNELSLYRYRLIYNCNNELKDKIISFKRLQYWYFDQIKKNEQRKEIKK